MIFSIAMAVVFASPALPPKREIRTLPGYDWTRVPLRAPGKPAPPPVPDEQVVADFLKHLVESASYDAAARDFAVGQYEQTNRDELKDFIHRILPVLSPGFRRGMALLDEDRLDEAADELEALSRSEDPFLAVAAAELAATTMIELGTVDRCQSMLDRVRRSHRPIERYTTGSGHFRFMLGYCQVHNLQYARAYATLEDFLKNHPNAPERLRVSASQILTELARRVPGKLGDVRDLLTYAHRKIRNRLTDVALLDRQDEAIALLDQLIEEAEEQESNQGGGEGSGSGKDGPSGGQRPGGGARRSMLPSGEGGVGELRKVRARPGEVWGKMPPKEREQVLQTLQRRFPSQYRELLEQYYKQLAKDASSP